MRGRPGWPRVAQVGRFGREVRKLCTRFVRRGGPDIALDVWVAEQQEA